MLVRFLKRSKIISIFTLILIKKLWSLNFDNLFDKVKNEHYGQKYLRIQRASFRVYDFNFYIWKHAAISQFQDIYVLFVLYLATAFVPSETACLANSPIDNDYNGIEYKN